MGGRDWREGGRETEVGRREGVRGGRDELIWREVCSLIDSVPLLTILLLI